MKDKIKSSRFTKNMERMAPRQIDPFCCDVRVTWLPYLIKLNWASKIREDINYANFITAWFHGDFRFEIEIWEGYSWSNLAFTFSLSRWSLCVKAHSFFFEISKMQISCQLKLNIFCAYCKPVDHNVIIQSEARTYKHLNLWVTTVIGKFRYNSCDPTDAYSSLRWQTRGGVNVYCIGRHVVEFEKCNSKCRITAFEILGMFERKMFRWLLQDVRRLLHATKKIFLCKIDVPSTDKQCLPV